MTGASTRQLTSAPLELVSDHRARVLMRATLVAVLVALATAAGLRLYADGAGVLAGRDQLRQENSALQADVARLEAELELERATRAALDAQVAELTGRIADLDRELAFVRAQNGPGTRLRPCPERAATPGRDDQLTSQGYRSCSAGNRIRRSRSPSSPA